MVNYALKILSYSNVRGVLKVNQFIDKFSIFNKSLSSTPIIPKLSPLYFFQSDYYNSNRNFFYIAKLVNKANYSRNNVNRIFYRHSTFRNDTIKGKDYNSQY